MIRAGLTAWVPAYAGTVWRAVKSRKLTGSSHFFSFMLPHLTSTGSADVSHFLISSDWSTDIDYTYSSRLCRCASSAVSWTSSEISRHDFCYPCFDCVLVLSYHLISPLAFICIFDSSAVTTVTDDNAWQVLRLSASPNVFPLAQTLRISSSEDGNATQPSIIYYMNVSSERHSLGLVY